MHNAEADAEHVNAALRLRGNYIKSRRQYLEPYCPCNGYRFKKRKVKIIVRDCTNEGRRDYDITEIDITESDVAEFDITENDITESDITETNIT